MKILAITGPFGSGKTTVSYFAAAALRGRGMNVAIVALDEVSREIVNDSLALRACLADAFGMHILHDDASLNRAALAELAFADDQSTAKLNALMHPPMIERARELLYLAQRDSDVAIIESPFPLVYFADLFEGFESEPLIWTVSASKELRLERGLADGYQMEDALRRMDRQPRISAYETEADQIIENSDNLDDLHLEVQMCLEQSGFGLEQSDLKSKQNPS